MTLEEKIMGDLKEAMKAKDTIALEAIRAIKSAILIAKTDGSGNAVDEAKETQILQKLVKQRRESLDIFTTQGRADLAEKEAGQLSVIEKYLPKMLNTAEVESILKEVIAEVGATSPKDMGIVMKGATARLAGKADGKLISETVKRLLQPA
ncbi:MAG: hypothetical protein RLZZ292_1536 [Bacteroidota bacterium]|jgi:uncharacterized protein YqeY